MVKQNRNVRHKLLLSHEKMKVNHEDTEKQNKQNIQTSNKMGVKIQKAILKMEIVKKQG